MPLSQLSHLSTLSCREMEKEESQTGLSGKAGEAKPYTFVYPSTDFKQTAGKARPNQIKTLKQETNNTAGAV